MTLWVEEKYLKLLSEKLPGFKQKSDKLWNCRCPICGDSQKNKRKQRGYFFPDDGNGQHLLYKCWNCGVSKSLYSMLKDFDPSLAQLYKLESFKSELMKEEVKVEYKPPETLSYLPDVTSDLKSIDELDSNHYAVQYVIDRKIPEPHWFRIKFTPYFIQWTLNHTDKFKDTKMFEHSRLVFPFYDENGIIFAYHARAFDEKLVRYFSIVLRTVKEKAFGLDQLTTSKRIYVVEGPIDSFFLPNCVAVGNANLSSFKRSDLDIVYIPDKDTRNTEVMKIVSKMIDSNLKVCMLPVDNSGKDLNQMVINGMSLGQLKALVDENTFQGLKAKLHFNQWRKL